MTGTQHLTETIEILIGELITDEELRGSFLRNPSQTLRSADDWGLPLTESELHALQMPSPRFWDQVVEELEARLSVA